MPPPKSRVTADDSRSDATTSKEKSLSTASSTGKNRRTGGNSTAATTPQLLAAAPSSIANASGPGALGVAVTDPSNGAGGPGNGGIQWSTLDVSILQGYRHAYRLNTPSAFGNPYNQYILASSSMGRMSPTMARRRGQRRQSKEQLANACRKHFNGLGIQENEAVVDFLYKVKFQDKSFRMRFAPTRNRRMENTASTVVQP